VRATLVACGTVGLLASLATAQQTRKPLAPEVQKKLAEQQKPSENANKAPQASVTGANKGNKSNNQVAQAGGGMTIVRGPSLAADDCALAPIVNEGSFGFDLFGFTGTDITSCTFSDTADGWWQYTATSDGIATVSTCGGTGDTSLSAFSGCGGSQIACNDDACGLLSTINFPVTNGGTYWVRVAGYNNTTPAGTATISVSGGGGPANDNCNSATVVNEGTHAYDLFGATNDWAGSCGASTAAEDVWFEYQATQTGNATVTTCGLAFNDTVLAVLAGCGGPEIGCNDDSTCGAQSTVSFPVTSGSSYWIRVADFNGGTHAGSVGISVAPPATNESCDVSNPVLTLGVPAFGDNSGTTTDTFLSDICGPFIGSGGEADLFYQFTAGADETYRFSTCGSTLDTVIAVFGGCPADEFINFLGCNDDFCGVQSSVDIPLTTGQTVYVRVSSYAGGPQGAFQVQVEVAPPPATNENCDIANPEVFLNTPEFGDTTGTASDVIVDGPCTFGGAPSTNDLFYRFTAPAAGCYDFSLCGSGYDTNLSIFSGCPADQFINLLGCNDDFCGLQSQVSGLQLAANQEVYIRVAGWNGAAGSFTLTVTDSPAPTPPPVCVDGTGATFVENEANCGIAGGDNVNGGCNSPSLAVQSVNVGDIIFGSGAFDGATRDTDWYEFSVGADTEVTLSLTAEFTADIFFMNTSCPTSLISGVVTVPACTPGSVSFCFAPGTYRFFIGANFDAGNAACAGCGLTDGADYVATLSGVPCVPPPPPADECDMAGVVTAPSTTNGSTVGLTGSDITSCTTGDAIDGWYQLTAPVTGSYTISLCGSVYDTALSVWGDCPPVTQLACNDDFCGFQSQVTLDLTGGETYYIRVSGYNGAAGTFVLDISAPPIPTGACCVGNVCTVETEADCLANSGSYQGDGTNCDGGITGGTVSSSSPFAAIPDSTFGSLTDTLTGSGGTISNLLVSLEIAHTWQGDLRVELTHVNSGTTVTLVDQPGTPGPGQGFGFSEDNYGSSGNPFILFDGAAQTYDTPQIAAPGILNVSGTWKPDLGPLSAFNGLDANSDWTLTITDNAGGDTGTLNSWSINVNPTIDNPCSGPAFCDADWCQDGSKSVADIFCFLADWFALDPDARTYGGAATPVQAIFAWLAVWFATPNGPCVP
jgi:hypothetical protein